METIWLDATDFSERGGFVLETQFVCEMGQAYLMADGVGEPVMPASVKFTVNEGGKYRFFARVKNWCVEHRPDGIILEVDGVRSGHTCAMMHVNGWYFEVGGDFELSCGEHTLSVYDTSGWFGRFAAVVITNNYDFYPSRELSMMKKQRREIKNVPDKVTDMGRYDLIVVGGGVAGVVAAISAARYGLKTALINNRPVLGGNGSDESAVTLDGSTHIGEHETGLVFEMKCYRETKNLTWSNVFDKYTSAEKDLTVFKNTLVTGAERAGDAVERVHAINTMTLEESIFSADRYVDASGDAWLGYYAGAYYRYGREARFQHGEPFAPEIADGNTMSGCAMRGISAPRPSICSFFAEPTDSHVNFTPPAWAFKLLDGDELGRTPRVYERGEWWLELQNDYDDVFEGEFVRDSMFRMSAGYFDWLKNSWSGRDAVANYKLRSLGTYLARRESRRLVGDRILSENDYVEGQSYPDAVCYCGWNIDVHHIDGIFSGKDGAFTVNRRPPITPIPFSALYSKNISNLMMAGRCISVTHIGLGPVRVQLTTATMGQAVGTAAYLCKKYGCTPREVRDEHIEELQQLLLKDGMTIPGVKHNDEKDLARKSRVSADSFIEGCEPENVINGKTRKREGEDYAWISNGPAPQNITLTFEEPTEIKQVRITLDFPFDKFGYGYSEYPKTPELVTDLNLHILTESGWIKVKEVRDNVWRLVLIDLDSIKVKAVKVEVVRVSDSDRVIIPEIRIY